MKSKITISTYLKHLIKCTCVKKKLHPKILECTYVKIKIKDEDFKDLSELSVVNFCKVLLNPMLNWYFFPKVNGHNYYKMNVPGTGIKNQKKFSDT